MVNFLELRTKKSLQLKQRSESRKHQKTNLIVIFMHLLKMTGNVDNYDLLRQSVAAEIKELPEIGKALIN